MKLSSTAIVVGAALGLSACATRGAVSITCDAFNEPNGRLVYELPQSSLVQQIQRGGASGVISLSASDDNTSEPLEDDPLTKAIAEALQTSFAKSGPIRDDASSYLLLSGGGQWGAFVTCSPEM